MAAVPLPPRPSLEQLRKRARELQRGHRATDAAHPLHLAQRELARHYGFASWPRLVSHVAAIEGLTWSAAPVVGGRPDEPPARFLRDVCVTFHGAEPDTAAALALLAATPGVVTSSLAAAAVAGDAPAVRAALDAGAVADEPEPPYGWTPLMYLAFSRLDVGRDAGVDVMTSLLDAGADPQAGRYFDGYPTPFTVLTGLFGAGEQGDPAHPHALALGRVLLGRGADPNDAQTLYNRMFDTADDALELLLEFGLGRGTGGAWRARLPDLAASPVEMVRGLLGWAVLHDQRDRVELLARHGTDLLAPLPVTSWSARPRTPVDVAAVNGHRDLVRALVERGCPPPRLTGVERWIGDALAGDEAAVDPGSAALAARARNRWPGLPAWAAAVGHGRAVEVLVSCGFDVDALGRADCPRPEPWQTALHTAVAAGDGGLVERLLALGADPTVEDARYRSSAAGWARFFGHEQLLPMLGAR